MKEDFACFKTVFWPVCLVVICTLGKPFSPDLRVVFRSYPMCGVRVVRPGLVVNLCSRSCSSVSSANNSLTLLSRLLSTWSFFTPYFDGCVLKVMDSEDRKHFRSTTGTVGSDISPSNCVGGFHISIGCSDIVSRDLDPTLVCSRPGCKNGNALWIHGCDKQTFAEGRARGFSSSMLFSNRTAGLLL